MRTWYEEYPEKLTVNQVLRTMSGGFAGGTDSFLDAAGAPLPSQAFALQPNARAKGERISTCEYDDGIPRRDPHKVSSAFPLHQSNKDVIACIEAYLARSTEFDRANTYISLHALGGQGSIEPDGGTAFAWRDKPFMMQIQAWWHDPDDESSDRYIGWVTEFRNALSQCAEGGFINFPDKQLSLRDYYRGNFAELRKIKRRYDPKNVLRFGMSIPPADN